LIGDCAVYQHGRRREGRLALEDAYEAAQEEGAFVWIELAEPTAEELDAVDREFGLHELAVENAIEAHQRPKIEVYGDMVLVVLKTCRWSAERHELHLGEIIAFLGDDLLLTVRHGETDLHDVHARLEGRAELLRNGPAAALHAVVDGVVDRYGPVLDQLDDKIRNIEEAVFSPSRASHGRRIYEIKREVLKLDAVIGPLVDPLSDIVEGRYEQIPKQLRTYFRNVHDHLERLATRVDHDRELLTNILGANLTQVNIRQNEDVRKISAWAAIFAIPTVVTGIYGMNFDHMPELGWTFGYPAALALMVVACLALYRYFHKVGWL